MSNLYATLDDVKTQLNVTGTGDNAFFLRLIEDASRWVDRYCGRYFYAKTASLYFDGPGSGNGLLVDDLLSITTFKVDTDSDDAYDDETWGTDDYLLYPLNTFPKMRIYQHPDGDFSFGSTARMIEIAGLWGFGNGESATPYEDTGINLGAQLAAGATSATAGAAGIEDGMTLLIGSEQIYVSAVATDTTLTIERGMNGTTDALHADTTDIYRYLYPRDVIRAAINLTIEAFNSRDKFEIMSERIGNYFYQKRANLFDDRIMARMLGRYMKRMAA